MIDIYRYRWAIALVAALSIPIYLIIAYSNSPLKATSIEEPYSIIILAGQSNAEGTNSFRSELPAGTGVDKQDHPADTESKLWWAGADGKGSNDIGLVELLQLFNGVSIAGWMYSHNGAGNDLTTSSSASRLTDMNDIQARGQFASELGASRTMYDMGRRKVVFLKVSYGFQTLAQSTSPFVPFDWNPNSTNKSYAKLKEEFTNLTDYITSTGSKYTVDGVYWMQGETDTMQPAYATAYQQNLTDLTTAMRRDFHLHPAAHIVLGKISMNYCTVHAWPLENAYCGNPYAETLEPLAFTSDVLQALPLHSDREQQVRQAEQAVADSDANSSDKIDVVETADLSRANPGNDFVHMAAAQQIELGKRFARMYELPKRFDLDLSRNTDYDQDGIANNLEDTGRGAGCALVTGPTAGNGNLGDDDTDCDGFPNYLDKINGPGSGI